MRPFMLAVHKLVITCINAARLLANTRPSHAAEIRFARRAARRDQRQLELPADDN